MRKQILGIIMLVGMIVLASAFYPGETITVEHNLGTPNLVYTIIDNSSELTILPNVTINSTHIQIYFPTDMPPNSFTMVFLEEQTNTIIKEVHVGGGGGGSSKTIYKNVTEYIEIDNYIDREVIVYVDKDVPEEVESKGFSLWFIILPIIFVLIICFVTWLVIGLRNKEDAE